MSSTAAFRSASQTVEAKYGSWKSPITSASIVANNIKLAEIRVDGDDIYWLEGRPTEGGRNVVVKWDSVKAIDISPEAPCNVRTRVHEYGGGSFQVHAGNVYFSKFNDQRIYVQKNSDAPIPITPQDVPMRYADADLDKKRKKLVCVREDHSSGEHGEPVNTVVAINVESPNLDAGSVLASGSDFYSSPRMSPDGNFLAYLSWDHPQMPWDGTKLWVVSVDEAGNCKDPNLIAGGETESVCQPEWSPDGNYLYFVSDRGEGGWWNLYRWRLGGGAEVHAVLPKATEFAAPHWTFARTQYGFLNARTLVCTYGLAGTQYLATVDTQTLQEHARVVPYTSVSDLKVSGGHVAFIAGHVARPATVVRLDLATLEAATLRDSGGDAGLPDEGYVSAAQPIEFPTAGDRTAHAYYYPPHNRDFQAPTDERPPLLVKVHGGPTSAASRSYNPGIQYWTSRGFAVCDVDYSGSSGYGRAYRDRLRGAWGVADVDDCAAAARHLAARGLADPQRLCIDGGSAGGYTTLAALVLREDFRVGASHYGVSDLESLARDTHKFEARYLDGLIGRYPEEAEVYRQRSPLTHAERLARPVIFFQGDEDRVVPPSQAEMMVDVLRRKGVPVAYVLFPGEQHGFRRAENIRRALDGQLYFFSKILGFDTADEIEPVPIENLP